MTQINQQDPILRYIFLAIIIMILLIIVYDCIHVYQLNKNAFRTAFCNIGTITAEIEA